ALGVRLGAILPLRARQIGRGRAGVVHEEVREQKKARLRAGKHDVAERPIVRYCRFSALALAARATSLLIMPTHSNKDLRALPSCAVYSHMADFASQPSPDGDTNPEGLVDVLLTLSPTGTMVLRPIYDASGELLSDFKLVRLNPAAQRLLQLPEQPVASLLTLLPEAHQDGVFAYYREAFSTGYLANHPRQYQHDGLASYTILAAQRHEQLLVVSLAATPAPTQPEHQTQLHEQPVPHLSGQPASGKAALHVAERLAPLAAQRGLLQQILRQVPAAVATLSGPKHHYTFFNDQYQTLSAQRVELGKTVVESLPELVTQGFVDLLDQVYATGQPFAGIDRPVQLLNHATGRVEQRAARRGLASRAGAAPARADGRGHIALSANPRVPHRRDPAATRSAGPGNRTGRAVGPGRGRAPRHHARVVGGPRHPYRRPGRVPSAVVLAQAFAQHPL
nr:hypothetical protein [Tanacetum cinerariifolium]